MSVSSLPPVLPRFPHLHSLSLTASHLPVLLPSEISHLTLPNVSLRLRPGLIAPALTFPSGILIISSHRLMWQPDKLTSNSSNSFTPSPIYFPLSHLKRVTLASSSSLLSFLSAPTEFTLHLADLPVYSNPESIRFDPESGLFLPLENEPLGHQSCAHDTIEVQCFNSKEAKRAFDMVESSLSQRAWHPYAEKQREKLDEKRRKKDNLDFSTQKAGVSGILRSVQVDSKRKEEKIDSSFRDLEGLMKNAADIVELAKKVKMQLAMKKSLAAGAGAAAARDRENDEMDAMTQMLENLGLVDPITRESVGDQYHEVLCRQVNDYLRPLLAQSDRQGIISVIDAFCLYNRARMTDLVSPDDFLTAARLLSRHPELGMKLIEFPSGVKLLALTELWDEQKVRERILAHLPRSAVELSMALNFPLSLVEIELRKAENDGAICRDQSIQGTVFYENRFPQYLQSANKHTNISALKT